MLSHDGGANGWQDERQGASSYDEGRYLRESVVPLLNDAGLAVARACLLARVSEPA